MKITTYLYLALLSAFSLTGCNNVCQECDENSFHNVGNLSLITDWSELWRGIKKPQKLDVYFYSPYQELQYFEITKDTTTLTVNTDEYDILAINDMTNITEIGSYHSARISLPRTKVNEKFITTQAPCILRALARASVNMQETSECFLVPVPLIFIINFRFIIKPDSSFGAIKECQAVLNGVITSLLLSGEKEKESLTASLPFTAIKNNTGYFDAKISVLGLSGENLEISALCENGEKKINIDLSGLFDFSSSPVQNCIIQVNFSTNQSVTVENISIEDWAQGEEDNIEI